MRLVQLRWMRRQTSSVRGVSLPVFRRGLTPFSWARFPDERKIDVVLLDDAERAAVIEGQESVVATAEEDLADDPIRPPAKRTATDAGAGAAPIPVDDA